MKLYLEGCDVCAVLREYEQRSQPQRDMVDYVYAAWVVPVLRLLDDLGSGCRTKREVRARFKRTIWLRYQEWRVWVLACEAVTRAVQDVCHPQCPSCGALMGWTHVTREADLCGTCTRRDVTNGYPPDTSHGLRLSLATATN